MRFLIFFEFFNHLLAFSLIIIFGDRGRKKVANFSHFRISPKFRNFFMTPHLPIQFEIRVKKPQNLAMFRPTEFIWIPNPPAYQSFRIRVIPSHYDTCANKH